MFGGEDSKRHLMDDLNILDLESLTWEAIETRYHFHSSYTMIMLSLSCSKIIA